MTGRSVTLRLVLAVVGLEVALIATFAVSVYFETNRFFEREFDKALAARADSIASLVDVRPDGRLAMESPHRPINRRSPTSSRPDLYRVWTDSGELIEQSAELADRSLEPAIESLPPPAPGRTAPFDTSWNGKPYRGVWAHYEIEPESSSTTASASPPYVCHVLLATSSSSLDDAAEDLIDFLLLLSGGMVLATAGVTVLLVRWGLRPVRRTARDIEGITTDNLGSRQVGTPNPPEEIRPFVQAINEMLARLAAAFRQQRSFTANASHELRTPMALIRSTLQSCLIGGRSIQEYRESMSEVLEDLDRVEHLVEQLLLLARLDEGQGGELSGVNLSAILTDLVGRYRGQAEQAGMRLDGPDAPDGPVWVLGIPELLERLFANLLDNAVQHCRPGDRVSVDWHVGDGWVTKPPFSKIPRSRFSPACAPKAGPSCASEAGTQTQVEAA